MDYSIKNLKEVFKKLEWDEPKYTKWLKLVQNIESTIDVEKIKQVYPKNLFVDEKEMVLLTFTDEFILTTNFTDESKKTISNTIIKIKDIKRLEKIEGNEYEATTLKICFYDGKEIVLNSSIDTNEHHMRGFNEVIDKIIKLLIRA